MRSLLEAAGILLPCLVLQTVSAAPAPIVSLVEPGLGNLDHLIHGTAGLDTGDVDSIIDDALTGLDALLKALNDGTVIQNGLVNVLDIGNMTKLKAGEVNGTASNCPDIAVLFARGTTEPGNMGLLTGPPLATALQHYENGTRVAIQGIDYNADVKNFLAGGSAQGAATMAALANITASMCPGTQISLSGYSQGALVVRKAINDTVPIDRISSVVLFGDPMNGTAVPKVPAGRVKIFCHEGDNICQGGVAVLPTHLSYSNDAAEAAMFMMQKSGLGLASSDAMQQGMGDIPTMGNSRKR